MAGNTWDGGSGTTGNWSDNANWNFDTAPGYGTLAFVGTTRTTNTIDANYSMNQINWNNSSGWTLNSSGGATLSLFDNGGTQAKIENLGSGTVTINAPITFAATTGNNWGEINAVSGPLTFASNTLTVNGSGVNGIRMFSGGQTVNFDTTVSASGKYFATTSGSGATLNVGGAFTSGDIYLMNGSTLNLNSGGSISTSALRLGGDFGTTGSQNLALGATFAFNAAGGGQSFGNTINTVGSNTSGALLVDSKNTSGVNTLSSGIFLDSNLRVQQASGGSLTVSGTTLDLKNQTLTLDGAGNIDVTGALSNSTGSGKLTKTGAGTATLSAANTHSGDTIIENGTLQFGQGGSAASSIVRVGNTSGSNAATLNISDADGGTTIGSTLVVRNGSSGTKTIGGTNTSGVNTYSGTVALDDAVTLSAATGGTTAFSGAISDGAGAGTFGLLVGGTGTVRFSGGGANSGISLYTVGNGATLDLAKTAGVTAVDSTLTVNNGGTVLLTNANQISDTAAVTVDGTFNLNGQTETIGSLAGASSGAVQTGGAQLIAGQNNGSTTFAGVVSGGGSFVKKGTGTLTLSGANTYSGDTFAVGGTTQFNAAQGVGFTGVLQVGETFGSDAATVAIGTGGVTIANNLTVRSGSSGVKTIAANNTSGTATFSGTTTLNDAVTLRAANGGALTMGAISQGANGLLVQAAAGNTITLAGNITGTGFLEKSAAFPGSVVLTGVKSSTGDLRINDGTFAIGSGGDVTAGTIFLGSNVHQLNTALELSAAGVDIDRNISVENAGGAETRTISSTAASGTTTLSGWVDLKRDLFVNANSGSTLAITTGVNLGFAGNNDINLSNSSPVNLTGAIAAASGASDLNKSGAGTLTIGGDNTGSLYKLNLAAGTTYLTHANALGTAYADKVNFLTANSELRVGATMAPASLGLTINSVTATVNTDSGVTFTVPGVIANAGGSGSLTKTGDGTLVLSGSAANTYAGSTAVNAGVLELAKTGAAALPDGDLTVGDGTGTDTVRLTGTGGDQITNASDVFFNAGGVLQLNGNNETIGRFTSNASGAGVVENTHASAGSVLTTNNDNTSSTFSGVLQDGGAGTLGLTKAGGGTLTLSGSSANTFTGPLTVQAGTLALNKSVANGAISSASVTIGDASGTDTLRLDAADQINDAALLTLRVGGVFRLNSFSETVGALSSFAADNGTVENNTSGTSTLSLSAASGTQTFSGVLQNGAAGTLALSKSGAGTQVLAGTVANTFTGATSVSGGVLELNKSAGVNAIAGDGTAATIDATVSAGTLRWAADNQVADNAYLSLAGGTLDVNGRTETVLRLAQSSGTFQTGAGTFILTGSGTAPSTVSAGVTTIGAGGFMQARTLQVSGGSVTVEGGATGGQLRIESDFLGGLSFPGGGAPVTLTLNSDNVSAGRLVLNNAIYTSDAVNMVSVVSGLSNTQPGAIDLNAGTRVFSVGNGAAATDLLVTARLQNGGLTKTGNGTLEFAGGIANTHAGVTAVNAGILDLNKTAGVNAIAGDGSTGTADVTIGGGTLRWLANNQVADDASISMTSGAMSLNGRSETMYGFSNSGGTFTTGVNGHLIGTGNTITWSGGVNTVNDGGLVQDAHIVISGGVNTVEGGATGGTLQLDAAGTGLEMTGGVLALNSDNAVAGKLTLKGDVTTFASATSSEINNALANTNPGAVDLDAGTRTFTVADGAAASDLYISARVQNGAVTKAGAGTLVLQGDNTYAGATAVNAGALNIRSPNALGTTAGSTTVASGAALEMQGGFTSAAEALSLNGTGISGGGALRNVSGNNTFSGAISLAGDTRISSDSGTLTLNSATALNGGGSNLSFGGAGDTTVSSVLSLGSGSLTKVGAGTFTLSSNNSIAGPTSVSAGTMRVSGKSNFTGNVSVSPSATLDLSGGTTGVDNLTVSTGGTLEWGTGRLTHATSVGTDGTTLDDASSPGYQFVMPGKTAQVTGNIASDAGSILQLHGSGANLLYGDVVNGVRFNNVEVTGDLDLSAGGTLELNFNPFLLRPISPQGQSIYEWGSIPLVRVSGQLTGALTVTGILTQGFGFFQPSGIANPTDGDDLALNTYKIEFDEFEDTIYLHYKIMGYVPEPGSFGLLFGGAAALRLLRRLNNSRRRITAAPSVSADTVSC